MPLSRPDLQFLRSLAQKKYRLAEGKILIEGTRLVESALASDANIERILCTTDYIRSQNGVDLRLALRSKNIDEEIISATQSEQLSQTRSPQGLFALIYWERERVEPEPSLPMLILDGISDPGNLGTLLRTADWFSLPAVRLSADSVDLVNPKVLRGAMGAHFHLPNLFQGDLTNLRTWLGEHRVPLFGGVLGGAPMSSIESSSVDQQTGWALVVGSEADGLSKSWLEVVDHPITIPGSGEAESLNVTVATGILLHHLLDVSPQ